MKLRYLRTFNSLFESTSAGSHDRGTSNVSPFKYAINFDHRIGYSKEDFIKDLSEIYTKSTHKERRDLMDFIFKNVGVFRISQIADLSQDRVDDLMKQLEDFLDSKAEYKPQFFPDGYFLCYENLTKGGRRCDVYYSPKEQMIKICFTDYYPEMEEIKYGLEEFSPQSIGIDPEDFSKLLDTFNNQKEDR